MSFGKLPKKSINFFIRHFIKIYFALGIAIIGSLYLFFLNRFQKQATFEARAIPMLISQFMYYSGHEEFEHILTRHVFQEIITNITFPIIYTDDAYTPVFWRNIDIPDGTHFDELSVHDQVKILRRLDKIKNQNNVIPLYQTEERQILGYTFFEDTDVMNRLKILPYIELVFFVLFLLFGLYVQAVLKRQEKEQIWSGLAKETAHQFGTPITSLIGWIDYLKMIIEDNPQKNELIPMLEDMNSDVELLKKATSRFGKLGSSIKLQKINIDTIINDCVNYFQKRLPHSNQKINITYIARQSNTSLMIDTELIQWALENLFKNCLDALTDKSGIIMLISFTIENKFFMQIRDDGEGIEKSMLKKVFEPGVTTKSRGWGLGLSLTKRIIEEYHHGEIYVLESTRGEGTVIEMWIPMTSD